MGENEMSLMPAAAPTVGLTVHAFRGGIGDPLAAIVVRANGMLPDLAILDPTVRVEGFRSALPLLEPVLAETVPHRVAGAAGYAWDWPPRA